MVTSREQTRQEHARLMDEAIHVMLTTKMLSALLDKKIKEFHGSKLEPKVS